MNNELKITRDEFLEKYGDVLVTFDSYYKYKFYFMGILPDGKILGCWLGGSADDIYRLEVNINPITIKELRPDEGMMKDGKTLLEWF